MSRLPSAVIDARNAGSDAGFVTADELLGHPEWGLCELVRGEVVRMSPANHRHGEVAALLVGYLFGHVRSRQAGRLYTAEAGFVLERNPDTVRASDVMFVSKRRIPADGLPSGYLPFPPDLAVEVVSPSDRFSDVMDKARTYIDAGVRLVWVIDPQTEQVCVFRSGQEVRVLAKTDRLDGADVLPDFELPIADLLAV